MSAPQVLRLGTESGCSAYGCEFVALAQALGVRLFAHNRHIQNQLPALASFLEDYIVSPS